MSEYSFSQVPQANIRRSRFDRSHSYKTAFNSGYLVPFYIDDVLPGDTFNLTTSMVARLTTPLLPVMDNIHIDTFFFFVPSRLVWNHFENFFGAQDNPGDSIDYTEPQVDLSGEGGAAVESIYDYLGVPPGVALSQPDWPSALPFRAINLIWNEWFRDQNLQNQLPVPKDDGPDPAANYTLLKRNKRHDYFTSCLPWPQKGPGVSLPLGTSAPVIGNGSTIGISDGTHIGGIYSGTVNSTPGFAYFRYPTDGSVPAIGGNVGSVSTFENNKWLGLTDDGEKSGLIADLSAATSATINSLREAFAMQTLMETLARSGSRYTELLRGVFDVVSPDARLQRPEYLGGSQDFITLHQVAQTSSSDTTSPQGHLTAFGYSSNVQHGFQKSFVEHGYVIGFVNVWTDLSYQQGLPRMFSRRTRWDYYWPQLAHIGEQSVHNREIFLQNSNDSTVLTGKDLPDGYPEGTTRGKVNADANAATFGYQERYAEYRYHPSMITGKLRSQTNTALDVWHFAQEFDTLPTLGSDFIEENPPLSRVLAVQNEPQIFLDAYFDLKCVRPMPLYGVPGFGSHF